MDETMPVKKEVTRGNILSIYTTLGALATTLVTLTLAYAAINSKNDLQDAEIARIKLDLIRVEAATIATAKDISVIQGDIRVIRQILEGHRPAAIPPR